jgi:hypothetical protein
MPRHYAGGFSNGEDKSLPQTVANPSNIEVAVCCPLLATQSSSTTASDDASFGLLGLWMNFNSCAEELTCPMNV